MPACPSRHLRPTAASSSPSSGGSTAALTSREKGLTPPPPCEDKAQGGGPSGGEAGLGSRLSPSGVSWQGFHAQQAGFLGVIVHNVGSDDLLNMVWEDGEWRQEALPWALGVPRLPRPPQLTAPLPPPDQLRRHITVPSVFTGETAATYLRSLFTYERGGHIILIPEYIFPLGYYLIPFTGVVGVVIAVMCTILVRGHRGLAERRGG
ncbi:E3 ubiquitin-protein ligase, partial [Ophiophagus hannah]